VTEEQLLSAALVNSPESVAIYGLDGTVVYMNPATERIMGVRFDDLRGKRLFDVFPDSVGNEFHSAFVRVVETGEPASIEHYYPRFDGYFANRICKVGTHVHVYAREVTEDRRRGRRLETLTRISDVLIRNELDVRGTAQAVAQIVTDALDAECVVALLSPDGQWLDAVGQVSRDPLTLELMRAVPRWNAHIGHPGEALRTRTAILVQTLEPTRVDLESDPRLRRMVERYRPSSLIVVPLIVGDSPTGLLLVSRGQDRPPLNHHDRTLLVEVASNIALYVALAGRRAEAGSLRNRLFAFGDAIPALLSFVDRDERFQYANVGYKRWFGKDHDQLVGRHISEVLGDDYERLKPHIEAALAGELVRFHQRMKYPTGERDTDVQYMPMRAADGSVEGFAVLVQDITPEVRISQLEKQQRDVERRATARLESLLLVTGKLAGAARREDVERVLVDAGVEALGATFTGMWTLSPEGRELLLVRERGMREDLMLSYRRIKMTTPGPITDSVLHAKPIFASSRDEYAQTYPYTEKAHRGPDPSPVAFAVLPLVIEGAVIGCQLFGFYDGRDLSNEERTLLEVLARHGSEALRRANLYAELRDVSETRAAMIQASPAAIMLLDEHAIVHAWNTAAERIFGVSALDAIGRRLPAADQQSDALDTLQRVLAGEEIHGREARRLRANGEWFDAEVHAAPVTFSDGRTMSLLMVVDITQRKRVDRGRALVTDASRTFARSLDTRRTLDEVVRLPVPILADFCCVDLNSDEGIPERVASSPEDVGSCAGKVCADRKPQLHTDTEGPMRSVLCVPLIAGDRMLGALTLAARTRNFDDLDLSIAYELANQAATAIENARLFEDARDARREAEDANRAKDEFLAMLGHELRNPLAPMVTALELARMRAPDQLQRERAVIERQVDHLSRLVDDLLDVSRITRGKVELRKERVSLTNVTAKAIEQTSPLFEQSRHRLSVDVPADLFVYGDPTRLAQIIANLLSNAAKYTPNQGSVSVSAKRRDHMIELTVRDNGVGILPEMLPQVFDLFVQAPQPSARQRGGLGLGLTIVRSLVEMHGGTVCVASEGKDKGSTFTIRLPESAEPKAVNEAERVPQMPRAAIARRILVVDDNEDAANLLAEVLVAHGHHIRTALDGPSALRVADEFQPEVAVLDIGLPVMDGYELAERLRSQPSLSTTRLIAVTGYGQESDRERALDAGFYAHLAKPVAIDTLVRLVDAAM
jgi:PAS domain S-box-containing protein